ncbi:FG-GAP-like repeat-containing protein [Streptomyces sp. S1]|uniref:FG-GAP-like repeat-containing protein n=1 Tax=Streptomyces sp. S1 TaxID=718288 RepID=UPI001F0912C3|nr:FG-GAP-like repeat-containing protein [Streptomyces sp. S1]
MTITAAALLGASFAPVAAAAPAEETPVQAAGPAPTPEETASEKAEETGKPVEVLARRTETSQLFANPSGTFTQEQYVLPRWTRQDGKLVTIDTNLAPAEDGRIAPKATTTGVSFSAGGTGPAVTLTRDGRKLSLTWPSPLPKPRTQGDSATYSEVLPGVDLVLRAGNSGFGQLFVVKTPEAAANPALKTLRFSMATDGLKVSADSAGNLTAVDAAGQEVFTAPTPRMWDSSTTATTATAAAPADASRARVASAPKPPADRFEPGHGAKEAVMDLALGKNSLSLEPDQSLLTGEDTTYPVFIDPTFSVPGSREAWAIAYKRTPNTAYYNGAGWHNSNGTVGTNEARVGYENETNGLGRSFFRMDSNNLWNTRKKIKKSTFRIKNIWSYSCQDRKVEAWFTGGISSSTTWNSQDNTSMWATKLDDVNESLGWGSGCPGGNLAFDVTVAATQAATKKLNNVTLGLRATSETDVYSWKKFDAGTAALSTEYNTYPNPPANLDTAPDTGTDNCLAGTGGLPRTVGNTDLTLSGTFSDPDQGTVKARFVLWPTGHGGANNEVNQIVDVPSGKGAKLVVLKTKLKSLLADAGVVGTGGFSWHARAEDGELASAWSPVCTFKFDATRPSTPPSVSSTEFPDGSDGWPETTGLARSTGTFTMRSNDPEPVLAIEYWTDWDPTIHRIYFGIRGGISGSARLTPPSVGRHVLSVRVVDMGGNLSDTTRYWYYANGTGIPDKPGDLNGDGIADFYGARSDGELWYYSGHGNGIMAPSSVASDQDFTGASITRRGDWTQDGYEDLVALIPGEDGKTLSVFPNNGFGHACSARNEQADGESKFCRYDALELKTLIDSNNHWSAATEILAIGDVDGPLDINGDGVIDPAVDQPGRPDLIVKEGDKLWLYFGGGSTYLDEARDPVLVGTGGWTNYSLAAPGDRDKNGHVDLFAQNKVTGELRFYPGTDTNGDRTDGEGIAAGGTSVVIGTSWTGANRPLFTAVPDADGDGTPDIWATTGDGKLYFYPNSLGSGTMVGIGGWTPFQDLA